MPALETAFLVTAILSTIGSVLSSLSKKDSTPRSAQDKYFDERVKEFREMAKKREAAMKIASIISGRPESSFGFGKSRVSEKYDIIAASGVSKDFSLNPYKDLGDVSPGSAGEKKIKEGIAFSKEYEVTPVTEPGGVPIISPRTKGENRLGIKLSKEEQDKINAAVDKQFDEAFHARIEAKLKPREPASEPTYGPMQSSAQEEKKLLPEVRASEYNINVPPPEGTNLYQERTAEMNAKSAEWIEEREKKKRKMLQSQGKLRV